MRARSPAEFVTAARAAGAVLVARWILQRGGFPAAIAHYGLQQAGPSDNGRGASPAPLKPEVQAARVAVRVLKLPFIGSSCLPTSLALADVLRRRGLAPIVVIGVGSRDGEFSAHAWVELGGRRIDASRIPPDQHREIARFSMAGRGVG